MDAGRLHMQSKGFTLIELMVVVVIIGILAAIAIPNFIAIKNRALEASVKANMHALQLAVEEFNTLVGGYFPGDLDTRVDQIDPTIPVPLGAMSLAAGGRVPPFPATALLRAHSGFRNPFQAGNNVIDNLAVGPPPPVPVLPSGCSYYSGYLWDEITPTGNGDAAYYYCITGFGSSAPLSLVLYP